MGARVRLEPLRHFSVLPVPNNRGKIPSLTGSKSRRFLEGLRVAVTPRLEVEFRNLLVYDPRVEVVDPSRVVDQSDGVDTDRPYEGERLTWFSAGLTFRRSSLRHPSTQSLVDVSSDRRKTY